MNKKDKEEVKIIEKLIKGLKRGFGGPCPELNVDCGKCKATMLIAQLEWYKDLLEWDTRIGELKKVLDNEQKLKTKWKTKTKN